MLSLKFNNGVAATGAVFEILMADSQEISIAEYIPPSYTEL